MTKSQHEFPENFGSFEEFWSFWDTHSTADYEDIMEDAEVQVDVRTSKIYCAIAKDTVSQIQARARQQGVSTETLVNLWLREKMMERAKKG
jgi:hypothetical protein